MCIRTVGYEFVAYVKGYMCLVDTKGDWIGKEAVIN
jgi:hypothetical protein